MRRSPRRRSRTSRSACSAASRDRCPLRGPGVRRPPEPPTGRSPVDELLVGQGPRARNVPRVGDARSPRNRWRGRASSAAPSRPACSTSASVRRTRGRNRGVNSVPTGRSTSQGTPHAWRAAATSLGCRPRTSSTRSRRSPRCSFEPRSSHEWAFGNRADRVTWRHRCSSSVPRATRISISSACARSRNGSAATSSRATRSPGASSLPPTPAAEALRVYDALRERLRDELGAAPAPELRALQEQLLRR